jgi:hypothetical protein
MNLLSRLGQQVVGRRAVLSALAAAVVGGAFGTHIASRPVPVQALVVSAAPAIDQHFVELGRSYRPDLENAYARAWDDGATALESGRGLNEALEVVSQAWAVNRLDAYNRRLTPELAKIVPEGKDHTVLGPAEIARMAAAWRGLAVGLR